MIGQKRLLTKIDRMIEIGFPRFSILCGETNSGKKTIAKSIAKKLNAHLIISEIKVDNIREIIELSYKQSEPTLYLIPDTDKASDAAKNILLKVTEEPPQKAYFIMTITDTQNILETLISRANVMHLDTYSTKEILEYVKLRAYELTSEEEEILINLCSTFGDIDLLCSYDILKFYGFVESVLDNIGVVSMANAFKIGQRLKHKKDGEGWDINLFFRAIMNISMQRMLKEVNIKYKKTIQVTSQYISQLNINTIQTSPLIDMWILEMRKIWVEKQ